MANLTGSPAGGQACGIATDRSEAGSSIGLRWNDCALN